MPVIKAGVGRGRAVKSNRGGVPAKEAVPTKAIKKEAARKGVGKSKVSPSKGRRKEKF